MARKPKPEEIIGKLREAEIVLAQGGTVADACRRIGVTEQSTAAKRKEYGDLKMDQARRMKELEKDNARLRRAVPPKYPHTTVARDNSAFWQLDGKILKQRDFRH